MTCLTSIQIPMWAEAKWTFTTRRVNRDDISSVSHEFDRAVPGDLILCEITRVGQHKRLQLASGRPSESYPGDLVVLCLGDRYAPDQFLGSAVCNGPLDLLAGGGVAGRVDAAHKFMSTPTQLRPIGLLADQHDDIINVAHYALPPLSANDTVSVIGVFGASMNSGKTTSATSLAHGLKKAGYGVFGVKATGTGAFGDFNAFEDAGVPVLDFTDVGMVTTFRMPLARIEAGFDTLVATAAQRGAEVVVVEIADGVFQPETREILRNSRIRQRLDGILFAAPDALGAMGGVLALERHGLSPFAISGMVSCSPLATLEAQDETGLPILSREELWDPEIIRRHVAPLMRNRTSVAA